MFVMLMQAVMVWLVQLQLTHSRNIFQNLYGVAWAVDACVCDEHISETTVCLLRLGCIMLSKAAAVFCSPMSNAQTFSVKCSWQPKEYKCPWQPKECLLGNQECECSWQPKESKCDCPMQHTIANNTRVL